MERGRPENPTIANLESAAAAASHIVEAFTIVMARQRINMTERDWQEYEYALDARDRLLGYLNALRGAKCS